jgi:hypothetical protein
MQSAEVGMVITDHFLLPLETQPPTSKSLSKDGKYAVFQILNTVSEKQNTSGYSGHSSQRVKIN